MKEIGILFICIIMCVACKDKNTIEKTSVPDFDMDSLVNVADSIGNDASEVLPPNTVDELFPDFIYSYSTNRSFQYERTKFPLKRYFSGKEGASLTQAQWKFDRLYFKKDLHIIICDSEESLEAEDISRTDSVTVECFKFEKQSVKQYIFKKNVGKWELISLNYFSLSKHPETDFLEFYELFATDSVFQRKHLAEYIDFVTYDDNEDETIEGIIDVEQWYAFHPELPFGNVFRVNYNNALKTSDVRVLSVRGNSNSWSSSFKFKKKNGAWKLVKFTN